MFMQELPPVIWLFAFFFSQMNILLLPDASVNREAVYKVKMKSTTFLGLQSNYMCLCESILRGPGP